MPPSFAAFQPQVVHFVIGILIVGVAMRVVAMTGRLKWTGPAATTLLVIGGVAAGSNWGIVWGVLFAVVAIANALVVRRSEVSDAETRWTG